MTGGHDRRVDRVPRQWMTVVRIVSPDINFVPVPGIILVKEGDTYRVRFTGSDNNTLEGMMVAKTLTEQDKEITQRLYTYLTSKDITIR